MEKSNYIFNIAVFVFYFLIKNTFVPVDTEGGYKDLRNLKDLVNLSISQKVDFNSQIKPILSDRCFKCHGPDKSKVEAGLQLTNFEGATALLKSGKRAVVPFKPDESELVKRITTTDLHDMMPSPKSNLTLNDTEKKLLIQWIEQGAVYDEHWAFIVPFKREIPILDNKTLAKNAIDHFIIQKLTENGLSLNEQATKETLIRRLSLDLIGLPPTVEEVRDFVKNDAPDAYESLVDRLLDSPHFGERMALDWLDVARYADSHGYQDDGWRNAYPYRDWVIRAFNQNLPYNQFVTWQLAGDLLPNPTRDQLIATCFNRNHQQTQEGGVVDEEYRMEYVTDRVNTFGKAFLGLTTECARCHTHKYDPITHSEYYQMSAFFNSNHEMGIIPYSGEASPALMLITEGGQKSLDSLRTLMRPYLARTQISDQYKADLKKWLSSPDPKGETGRTKNSTNYGRLVYFDFEPSPDSLLYDAVDPPSKKELEKRAKAVEEAKKDSTKKISPPYKYVGFLNRDTFSGTRAAVFTGDKDRYPEITEGVTGRGLRFRGEAGVQFGKALDFEKNQAFSVSLWVKLLKEGETGMIFGKTNGEFEGHRGYLCYLNKDRTLSFRINHVYPANGIDLQTIDKLPLNEWMNLAMVYDGSSKSNGLQIFINGQTPQYKVVADHLERSILKTSAPSTPNWSIAPFRLGIEFRETMEHIEMDELQVWRRQLAPIEVRQIFDNQPIISSLISKKRKTPDEQKQLLTYYLLSGQNRVFNENRDSLTALRGKETAIMTAQEEVMIMQELAEPRTTYRLNRGAYDAPAEVVTMGTPVKILAFDTTKYLKNRLGLAQWLLDEKNPLFARVAVNRYWQMLFGKGLVETQEDFGNQGAMPSHPALLDWLAIDFREKNWNTKAFLKQIIMSATYRQSSTPTAAAKEKDFGNTWYSHYPAHRLSAELVRDNALAASGLLVKKIGGASVFPYQPAGIWEALATRNATVYHQNHGDSLYRRSLYTIWKRSAPPPAMLNFDATDRAYCAVRRQKTASPLQALVLMNDPQFVEAARILAEKAMGSTPSVSARLIYCFQALTSRLPRDLELIELEKLFDKQHLYFQQNPEKAADLLAVGEYERNRNLDAAEVSAYTVVASMLMNFDEFVVIR